MKALYITNVMKRLSEGLESHLILLNELGYEVHIAGDFRQYQGNIKEIPAKVNQIDLDRSPFKMKNIKAFNQMIKLMKNEKYDFVHCNTPVGGMLGRMCAYFSGTRNVLYQAHGFHFYNGAPKLHNFVYKNIEKFLARFTDNIITINKEDYEAAQKFKVRRNGKIYYVPGVGINIKKIIDTESRRDNLYNELGLTQENFIIISAGELNENKNQKVVIEAISNIEENKNIHYIVCGVGQLEGELKSLAEGKGISDNIHFLGYRKDIINLMKYSDVFIMSSYREGLSRAIMEAMAVGLPVIASNIRGNVDLIQANKGGFLCDCNNEKEFRLAIEKLMDDELRSNMGNFNMQYSQRFDIDNIKTNMEEIYRLQLNNI